MLEQINLKDNENLDTSEYIMDIIQASGSGMS